MTVEQFEQIISLLGGVTTIGIGALIAFVLFKLVIYLSTAGAVVYCIKLVVTSVKEHLDNRQAAQIEITKNPPPVPGKLIGGLVINDEVLARVDIVLREIIEHNNRDNCISNFRREYFHGSDAAWLSQVVSSAIKSELEAEKE